MLAVCFSIFFSGRIASLKFHIRYFSQFSHWKLSSWQFPRKIALNITEAFKKSARNRLFDAKFLTRGICSTLDSYSRRTTLFRTVYLETTTVISHCQLSPLSIDYLCTSLCGVSEIRFQQSNIDSELLTSYVKLRRRKRKRDRTRALAALKCRRLPNIWQRSPRRHESPEETLLGGWVTRRCVRLGVSRPRSRELAPSQADWLELASFLAAASRRLPGHDLASTPGSLPFARSRSVVRSFVSTLHVRQGERESFHGHVYRISPRVCVWIFAVPPSPVSG